MDVRNPPQWRQPFDRLYGAMLDQQRNGGKEYDCEQSLVHHRGWQRVLAPAPLGRHERLVTASPPEETSTTCAPHGLAQHYKESTMNLIINTLIEGLVFVNRTLTTTSFVPQW